VALAQAAIEQLQLDILHVVPTGHAWHKQRPLTAAVHRLEMCRLAFDDVYRAVVDARETLRQGSTYTIDTLEELHTQYSGARLFLIIGEDQAKALHTWHRAGDLGRTAIICIASRAWASSVEGSSEFLNPLYGSPPLRLQLPPSPLNATEIRELLARGQSVAPLVFESVARYIDQHHLYQAA
jgi:nicotinate-nucleotide adenylyltransferase